MKHINIKNSILLMADATIASGGAEEVDPMSQAASGIDTTFPILKGDRILQMEIVQCRKVPVKDKPDRFNLEFKLKTTKEATMNDGRTAQPGFTGYKRISISTSEPSEDPNTGKKSAGRTNKDIAKDLGQVLKACGKAGVNGAPDVQPRELVNNPEMLDGVLVDMRVGVNPAKNNFPESNSFSFVIPAS